MAGAVHRYRTRLEWVGSTALGYDHYDRGHRLWAVTDTGRVAPAGPDGLHLSSDPTFLGDPTRLNPEQLLVAAVSSCHFLSFVAIAARRRLDVVAYADDAGGEMPEDDRPMRITCVVLHPQVTLRATDAASAPTADAVATLHHKAHQLCFVANSLTTEILVEPSFTVVG
jgi:organic hydroperoxide reductase OsmC/OhrA